MDCIKDLPVDVLSKIVSYKIGEPEYVKIKHSETLKRTQNKYKISRLGPKIDKKIRQRNKMCIIEHCIMREEVPFSLKSLGNNITEEKEELLFLINEEVEEDDSNFRVKLDIEVQIVAKLPDKDYGDNELSFRNLLHE